MDITHHTIPNVMYQAAYMYNRANDRANDRATGLGLWQGKSGNDRHREAFCELYHTVEQIHLDKKHDRMTKW